MLKHAFSWFLALVVTIVTMLPAQATVETAEVLPSGVPNFILEGQYSLDSYSGQLSSAATNFGATYHFGIGFEVGPVPFDFDLYRRFGPSLATESAAVFETQYLNRRWASWIPFEASTLYGVVSKSSDIRQSVQGGSTIYAARFGLVFSRHFKSKYFDFTPLTSFQGDVEFTNGTQFAGNITLGVAARPWFLKLLRFYLEGQVNIQRSIHAIGMGLEVVLMPIVEERTF